MSDFHKSWLYWSIFILVSIVVGFTIVNSVLVRLVIFFTLIMLLSFDVYRQFRSQKKSILLTIKDMVVKFFDIITSLG